MNIWSLYAELIVSLIVGFVLVQLDLLVGSIVHMPIIVVTLLGFLVSIYTRRWVAVGPLAAMLLVVVHIQLRNPLPWLLMLVICTIVLRLTKALINSTSAPLASAMTAGMLVQLYWLIGKKIVFYPYFAYTIAIITGTIMVAIITDRIIMGGRGNRSWNF